LSTTAHGDAIAHAQPGGRAAAAPPVLGQPGGVSGGTPDPALADRAGPRAGSQYRGLGTANGEGSRVQGRGTTGDGRA
jgi:hypothetical protein